MPLPPKMLSIEQRAPGQVTPELVNYLYRFDGGAWLMYPINGAPDTLILFPSRYACRAWKQTPQHRLEVEIFDRMWLPFDATSSEAQKEAAWWGYQTKPIGDDTFELDNIWDGQPDRALVTYDNEKARMVDVNYVMDTPEAMRAVTTIRTHLVQADEPPEARILFQWSDDMGIAPVTNAMD